MNWRSLRYWLTISACAVLVACQGGAPAKRATSTVTITVSTGRTAAAEPAVQKAPPTVASLRFTISGADMDTIVEEVSVSLPATVEESFEVLNGSDRVFTVEALNAAGESIYGGSSAPQTLDGAEVSLAITLQKLFFTGTQLAGTTLADTASAVARDGSGNLIIVGETYGDMQGILNSDPAHATTDVFVVKYDLTGARLWTRQFGVNGFDLAGGVAVDSSGNIYVVGSTDGNFFGQANTDTTLQTTDVFTVKLDPDGNMLWVRLLGSTDFDFGAAAAVDGSGNVYLAGTTYGGIAGFTNAGAGYTDHFAAKYDSSGTLLWVEQRGTSWNDSAQGIAVDGSGNVYMAGSTDGGLDGNANQALTVPSTADLFVTKLTTDGSWLWTRQLGSPDLDQAWAVAADSAGTVYVAGGTWGGLDGNANVDTSTTTADLYLVTFSSSGVKQWTRQLGSAGNDIARGVAVEETRGLVYVTGSASGSVSGSAAFGGSDAVVAQYDTAGALQWVRQNGTTSSDEGAAAAVDTRGNVFIAGGTGGGLDGVPNAGSTDAFLLSYDRNGTEYTP